MNNIPGHLNNHADIVRSLLRLESEHLQQCADHVSEGVNEAVRFILSCRGHLVLTGIGKSGLVARKISATMSSTGTPSFFLHPSEAGHGDLGMLTQQDILMVLSESGESDEIISIIPSVRNMGVSVILITYRENSHLAQMVDVVIALPKVKKGTYNLGPAPTLTATAMMALGDGIALACAEARNFGPGDFARYHPSGALGRKLLCKVSDLMRTGDAIPLVYNYDKVSEALIIMSQKGQGAVFVMTEDNSQQQFVGILTDGDIRRNLLKHRDIWDLAVETVMTRSPFNILDTSLAIDALKFMEDNKVTILPVLNTKCQVVGSIHMHNLIEAGIK